MCILLLGIDVIAFSATFIVQDGMFWLTTLGPNNNSRPARPAMTGQYHGLPLLSSVSELEFRMVRHNARD